MKPYYEDEYTTLYLGDTFETLSKLPKESVDMIFADPPYFLSNGGISCQAGKQVSVNKGKWDEGFTLNEKHQFNRKWLRRCKRVMKPNATIWISGTLHNIYSIGMALEQEGFHIINNITWQKTNPPPNLACRCFTHSTETVIWARKDDKKAKHTFNYALMKEENGENHIVSNLYDYGTGVETGLDSNGRKNRGGHLMENPVEKYLIADGCVYYKEMYSDRIEEVFSIDLSPMTNNGRTKKRFDFVIKGQSTVYLCETNFYSGGGGGSKLNETARSYKTLALEARQVEGAKFVWFTDGTAWNNAAGNLRETFDVLDTMYNINDLENGILKKLVEGENNERKSGHLPGMWRNHSNRQQL